MKLSTKIFILNLLCHFLCAGITPAKAFEFSPRDFLLKHPQLLNSQLKATVRNRCVFYLPRNISNCLKASELLIQKLDLDLVDVAGTRYIVPFSSDLLALHNQTSMQILTKLELKLKEQLSTVESLFYVAPDSIRPLDLGKILIEMGLSKEISLKYLSLLLMDLPEDQIQIYYWAEKFGNQDPLTQRLASVIRVISEFKKGPYHLSAFGVPFLNYRVYHFLVPAYLSSEFKNAGLDKHTSYYSAFLFNYLYEILNLMPQYKVLVSEPTKIQDRSAQDDILMGQAGAYYGLDIKVDMTELEILRELMTMNTQRYIQESFKFLL